MTLHFPGLHQYNSMPLVAFLLVYTTVFKSRLWMATHSECGMEPKQSEKGKKIKDFNQRSIYRTQIFVFPMIEKSVQKVAGCTIVNPSLNTKVTLK